MALCDWLLSLSALFLYKTPPLSGNLTTRLVLYAPLKQTQGPTLGRFYRHGVKCMKFNMPCVSPHVILFSLQLGSRPRFGLVESRHKSPPNRHHEEAVSPHSKGPKCCQHSLCDPSKLLAGSGSYASELLGNSGNSCTATAQSSAGYHRDAQHMAAISISTTVNWISIPGKASLS